jgi:phosphoribosylglycinamide formyltransferase-1
MHNLGILLSGRGSNFLAIADAIDAGKIPNAQIAVVISNIPDAPGLDAARVRGLNAIAIPANGRKRAEHDAEIIACLHDHAVDLVCLAGYMRLLSPGFIQAFPQRILNIHPSLLPAFPGLDAQTQAFDYGVQVAGCTVHFVDEHLDHGVIILQRAIEVQDEDTAESLATRILAEEHLAYTEAIARVASGQYEILDRRFVAAK